MSCYLCGKSITMSDSQTSDHVVPVLLLESKQPKRRGFTYAGRLRTHQQCNNHFADEGFFKKAIHLLELLHVGNAHGALRHARRPDITILPVTPDQVSRFVGRDFARFNFIDARTLDVARLADPNFYLDKTKINLKLEAAQAAITVLAKSAAALLVKRQLVKIPSHWRIYASIYEAMSLGSFAEQFGSPTFFDNRTVVAIDQIGEDEWQVAYQHKSFLILFVFVFHKVTIELDRIFTIPGSEIHEFSGDSRNELLTRKWHVIQS